MIVTPRCQITDTSKGAHRGFESVQFFLYPFSRNMGVWIREVLFFLPRQGGAVRFGLVHQRALELFRDRGGWCSECSNLRRRPARTRSSHQCIYRKRRDIFSLYIYLCAGEIYTGMKPFQTGREPIVIDSNTVGKGMVILWKTLNRRGELAISDSLPKCSWLAAQPRFVKPVNLGWEASWPSTYYYCKHAAFVLWAQSLKMDNKPERQTIIKV